VATTTCCLVRPDTYRDSVELMRVAALVERLPNVSTRPARWEVERAARILDMAL